MTATTGRAHPHTSPAAGRLLRPQGSSDGAFRAPATSVTGQAEAPVATSCRPSWDAGDPRCEQNVARLLHVCSAVSLGLIPLGMRGGVPTTVLVACSII
eukprot:scaffold4079_cov392-Prasinococcus_capsulatus_cf.AAC.6